MKKTVSDASEAERMGRPDIVQNPKRGRSSDDAYQVLHVPWPQGSDGHTPDVARPEGRSS